MMQGARLLIGLAATVALALSLAVHIASIRGVDIEASVPQVWWLHMTSIVLCGATLPLAMRAAGPKPRFRDLIATIPSWALAAIIVALLYVGANFVLLVPPTGVGAPVLTHGGYFFNDHGTTREASESMFHAQRAATLRLYSGVWLYLCLISAVLLLLAQPRASLGDPGRGADSRVRKC